MWMYFGRKENVYLLLLLIQDQNDFCRKIFLQFRYILGKNSIFEKNSPAFFAIWKAYHGRFLPKNSEMFYCIFANKLSKKFSRVCSENWHNEIKTHSFITWQSVFFEETKGLNNPPLKQCHPIRNAFVASRPFIEKSNQSIIQYAWKWFHESFFIPK